MENKLQVMPVPGAVRRDNRFSLCVRPVDRKEWIDVPLYAVKVDMHDVRQAAAAIFDFTGTVEVCIRPHLPWVYSAVVRPLSKGIVPECDGKEIRFTLDKPAALMIEVNGERFHCLHLFAGSITETPRENIIRLEGAPSGCRTAETRRLLPRLAAMPKGRTLVFGPGFHVIDEYLFPVASDTNIHLETGAVVLGGFVLQRAENVCITGHGVILQEGIHRYSGINGIRVSHSRNVHIEGMTFINPAHYTVYLGGSEDVTIRSIRSFSCEGWGDGIDTMSCRRVHVDGCFLRTSDDCVTVYGRRWEYNGDARDFLVENCTLWADVAHPINIGGHGDYEHDGNLLENLTFRNIDILEHHEPQPGYLGCMSINAGDKNTVQNVLFEDIRVEHIEHGKLLDVQVVHNAKYNPVSGHQIRNITFRNIRCDCVPPVASVIAGYSAEHPVSGVRLENVTVCGQPADVRILEYAEDVQFINSES